MGCVIYTLPKSIDPSLGVLGFAKHSRTTACGGRTRPFDLIRRLGRRAGGGGARLRGSGRRGRGGRIPWDERAMTCAPSPRARAGCTRFVRAECRRLQNRFRPRCKLWRCGWRDGGCLPDTGRSTCAPWFLPGYARGSCHCRPQSHSAACVRRAATGRIRVSRPCMGTPVHLVLLPLISRFPSVGTIAEQGFPWTLECVRVKRAWLRPFVGKNVLEEKSPQRKRRKLETLRPI